MLLVTLKVSAIYQEYSNAKEVTKRRIYLETMEEVLSKMSKIIIDKDLFWGCSLSFFDQLKE